MEEPPSTTAASTLSENSVTAAGQGSIVRATSTLVDFHPVVGLLTQYSFAPNGDPIATGVTEAPITTLVETEYFYYSTTIQTTLSVSATSSLPPAPISSLANSSSVMDPPQDTHPFFTGIQNPHSLSHSSKIGIGIGVPIAVFACVLLALLAYRRYRRSRSGSPAAVLKHDIQEEEKQVLETRNGEAEGSNDITRMDEGGGGMDGIYRDRK